MDERLVRYVELRRQITLNQPIAIRAGGTAYSIGSINGH
jgi:hypothetical protein